jgi:uncharacterized membrane protein YoaK (UPF0700 family)
MKQENKTIDIVHVQQKTRDRFLLLLACAAGGMDALGLLGLGGVFTSALSGNTILLGIAVVQGHLEEAVLCSVVFLGFIPGAVSGAMLLRSVPRGSQWTPRVTAALALESAVLLVLVASFWLIGNAATTASLALLIGLSAFAMGLQYMTMFRLNVKGVTTTFVTSTVVNLACRLALQEKEPKDAPGAGGPEGEGGAACLSDRTNLFLGLVWGAYFSGAMLSAALTTLNDAAAAALSFLLVFAVVSTVYLRARMGHDRLTAT